MDFSPLYKDKRIWKISTDGQTITRTYGVINGKMQVKESKGTKHIAQKLWQSQQMKGYKPREEFKFAPMYSHPYQMFRNKLPKYVYIQPEYDGIRIYIEYTDDRRIKLSAVDGAEINHGFKKIRTHFEGILPSQNVVVDGELRNANMTFDELCKCYENGEDEHLEYHVTDCFMKSAPNSIFVERRLLLDVLMSGSFIGHNGIGPATCDRVEKIDIEEAFGNCALQHYEGFNIYDPKSVYTPGKRNRGFLKIKHPKRKEYEICNISTNTWVCKTPLGVEFNVTSSNDKTPRYVVLKFKDYTSEGVPKGPIYVSSRN